MANQKVKTTGTGGPGRYCKREEAKVGARKARRREDAAAESGYRDCGCRDCFEIAIGAPGALCHACVTAGCEPDSECQAPGAYGTDEEE